MPVKHVLQHLHLSRITPFSHASTIQNILVSRALEHKALLSSPSPPTPLPGAPPPTLLTFVPTPVYTLGRREANSLSASQIAALEQPLIRTIATNEDAKKVKVREYAKVVQTLRGGQITFHGPGQLVIYPILDIKAVRSPLWPAGLTARCYVNVLEEATIRFLDKWYPEAKGIRTENPGIWIDEDRKIAALGVHLRRNVASFGVGFNFSTDLQWFDRIVACGLEGKKMTTLNIEGVTLYPKAHRLAKQWANEFAACLWGEDAAVEKMADEEFLHLVNGLVIQPDSTRDLIKWKSTGEQAYNTSGWPVPLKAKSSRKVLETTTGTPT